MSRKSTAVSFLASVAVGLLLMGCVTTLDLEPDEAVNPLGTEHTVTLTVEVCSITDPGCIPLPGAQAPGDNVYFEIVSGPNAGLNSDGDCGATGSDPCFVPSEGGSISWTYTGDGGPGTDQLRACSILGESEIQQILENAAEQANMAPEQLLTLLQAQAQSQVPAQLEIEPYCVTLFATAEKTWEAPTPTPAPSPTVESRERVERSVPNIGAGLSGLFAGQPTPLPTARPAVATSPSQVIRPPSTGDAGLR